jgi:hypothetical protein
VSTADLRAAAERLRRQARMTEEGARLARLNSELSGCAMCLAHGDASEQLARTCERAADALMAAIDLYEKAHQKVHGLPPQPDRPSLRVVGEEPPGAA